MRSTGLVRKMDDLGRTVLPKRVRRLSGIRKGDPVEVFVGRDGSIHLKKFSYLGMVDDLIQMYTDSLHNVTKAIVLISDTDKYVVVSGKPVDDYIDVTVGHEMRDDIRKVFKDREVVMDLGISFMSVKVPIRVNGSVEGQVILQYSDARRGDDFRALASVAAKFISKIIEI